jgi:hypothetical protein
MSNAVNQPTGRRADGALNQGPSREVSNNDNFGDYLHCSLASSH